MNRKEFAGRLAELTARTAALKKELDRTERKIRENERLKDNLIRHYENQSFAESSYRFGDNIEDGSETYTVAGARFHDGNIHLLLGRRHPDGTPDYGDMFISNIIIG